MGHPSGPTLCTAVGDPTLRFEASRLVSVVVLGHILESALALGYLPCSYYVTGLHVPMDLRRGRQLQYYLMGQVPEVPKVLEVDPPAIITKRQRLIYIIIIAWPWRNPKTSVLSSIYV
jgi:hypothetical protein